MQTKGKQRLSESQCTEGLVSASWHAKDMREYGGQVNEYRGQVSVYRRASKCMCQCSVQCAMLQVVVNRSAVCNSVTVTVTVR